MRTLRAQAIAMVVSLLALTSCGGDGDGDGDLSASESISDTASETRSAAATDDSSATVDAPTSTSTSTSTSSPRPKKTKPRQPAIGTRIIASNSAFGEVLFDKTGQAIYIFDVETTATPECYGECAVAWPPVLTKGKPQAGKGIEPKLLGTTKRTDGSTQVTYKGQPLYFYVDEGKYEVKCHDIFLNGGNWYAVAPNGNRAP